MATLTANITAAIDAIDATAVASGLSGATAAARVVFTTPSVTDTAVTVANYYRNFSRCTALFTAAVVLSIV